MPTQVNKATIKTTIKSTGLWIKYHARLHTVVAVLVFAVGLGATLYYWNNLRQSVRADMDTAYAKQGQMIYEAVAARMNIYENFLKGAAGLFAIHDGLTQADWEKYHQPYNMSKNYPDIRSVGASRHLTEQSLPTYLDRREAQGEPNFQIFPAGQRALYAPVTFAINFDDRPAVQRGFDDYTDPTRQVAMHRAVAANQMVMSGKVTLPGTESQKRSTFILYLPVYAAGQPVGTTAERQSSLLGFVYITVDTNAFVDTVLSANRSPDIALRIVDAERPAAGQLTYQSGNFAAVQKEPGVKTQTTAPTMYGHKWETTFAASPALLSERQRQLPEQALWRGLVSCIFFAGLVWYLVTDRERKYAQQKHQEVQTAKDDLLSLASHQLRTPATVVKQYVGMLLQGYGGKMTKQQLNMLDNAYNSNERQLEIINQLLYVARLDANRITLHPKKTDMSKLVHEVARDHSEAIAAREQTLTFKLPKRSPYAHVDPHYMRMVVENLLSNAVKYTPTHGAISLELKRVLTELFIIVQDNGVGIERAAQKSIFDKFSRIENELSTDVNGSGVGLYLTKEIVELHSGTIEVQSEAEKGSTFTVRIPLRGPRDSGS